MIFSRFNLWLAVLIISVSSLHFYGQTFSSNLPIVKINTNGKSIPNSVKITADLKIINNGEGNRNNITDVPNDYNGKIGIELRGSSSQMFPKKQYSLETRDSLGNPLDSHVLGLPKENDWVLSASFNDKSFIRDVLAFKIMTEMGYYSSRYKFCELFLNGEYRGIYILFEKIKRNKNRVDISKLALTSSTGDSLTGGYIIKIDKWDGEGNAGWESNFLPQPYSAYKIYYQYHYPKPEDITLQQKNYIQNFIRVFEAVMAGSQFSDTTNGYPKYIDVDSFVDNFIINEFSRNVDGYRLSTFFYKDRDSKNPKLFAGPLWDYNLAFGNADYYDGWLTEGWEINYLTTDQSFISGDSYQPPFWWGKLYKDPRFMTKVKSRWKELRSNILSETYINHFIDSLAVQLDEAQQRNFALWKILGTYVWPNPYDEWILSTYGEQITYLKNWIKQRIAWIDYQLGLSDVKEDRGNLPTTFKLYQNYPNPFNPSTSIKYNIPENGFVKLMIFDILGREVKTLVNGSRSAGNHIEKWNATNFASGLYFYQLEFTAQGMSKTTLRKKMVLTK
ncbi:MAG: CotH kinase family protein [Ignavibacteriales bacterium]|nr:CotH kinase family protein [Ignavibacteriales bacterium]